MVTVVAVVLAFFGALAFARYDWKGRTWYQKMVLLPIFFPQSVLGLALLLWFNALGLPLLAYRDLRPSRLDRAGGDAGRIDPGLQLRPGARGGGVRPRRDALAGDARDHHPVLMPGLFSGGLFAFLLSWGTSASLYTTGADTGGARVPLRQDGRGLHARRPGARRHLDHRRRGAADRWLSSCCWRSIAAAGSRTRRVTYKKKLEEEKAMLTALDGKSVLVTGASKGIEQGHRPGLRPPRREGAGRCAAISMRPGPPPTRSSPRAATSACAADIRRLRQHGGRRSGSRRPPWRPRHPAPSAGIFPQAKIEEMSPEQWDEVLDNLKGTFISVKACIPALKASGAGRIVVTSSITGPVTGYPGWTLRRVEGGPARLHTASIELAKYGITVNAVLPGNIVTEGLEGLGADYLKTMAASIRSTPRLGRGHLFLPALFPRLEGGRLHHQPDHHRRRRPDPARSLEALNA